jgi:CheY-like chemotaxis protein
MSSQHATVMAQLLGRVLIVEPATAPARMLAELLRNICPGQVWTEPTTAKGLLVAQRIDLSLIFVEYAGDDLDGLAFTRALRRSAFACRKAPVIMVTSQATPAAILGARDAGVHEFLRKPFTNKDLMRRLDAVSLHPRGWVEAVGYVGPDRRRFNSAEFKGARKRLVDAAAQASPERLRIVQALKIVASAVRSIDKDPAQVRRALDAQAMEILKAARDLGDERLQSAAAELQAYIAEAAAGGPLTRATLTPLTDKLLAFLPKDSPSRTQAA